MKNELPSKLHSNNFDAVRLVAALVVLVGHSWPLTGVSAPPEILHIKIYDLAVYAFFAVSGFLITRSWLLSPDPRRFLISRALRIVPALVIVVIATTFVLGPVVSTRAAAAYFADSDSWGYLSSLLFVPQYDLPGVFEGNPDSGIVNGVLWSLGPEVVCYLLVLALGLAFAPWPLARAALLLTALISLTLLPLGDLEWPVISAVFFAVGGVLANLRPRPARLGAFALGASLAWWLASHVVGEVVWPLAWLALPCALVYIGTASWPVVRRAGRFGDFSYGLYLWGFPVQQTVWLVAPDLPLVGNVAVVVAITGALACSSWHLVEKRMLRLKPASRVSPAAEGLPPTARTVAQPAG